MSTLHDRLREMHLRGMLEAYEEQLEAPAFLQLPFEERLSLLIDREWTRRQNTRQARLLKEAKFRLRAAPEELDLTTPRGLDRGLFLTLSSGDWVRRHQNLLLTGPTGIGKTFLACALGQAACRQGLTARYYRTSRLLVQFTVALGDGSFPRLMETLTKVRLLILDDWGLEPLSDGHGRALLDLLDDRVGRTSTLIASQLPVEHWHQLIANPTVADAIMDRLVHTAHRIVLKGDSMRQIMATSVPSSERGGDFIT